MSFKFRLETSLNLADQELKIAQGLLAQETRILLNVSELRDSQSRLLTRALEGQKRACLEEPVNISIWQKYAGEQNEKLLKLQKEVEKQQKIVADYREKLRECRIKVEKYKRLKGKKMKLYSILELKKEQKAIDEIAQSRTGWRR